MSRPVKTMMTSLVILLIIAIAAIVVILNVNKEKDGAKEPTIDEIVEYSFESPEITTDLDDGSYVVVQFQIVTDGKDAQEEISKMDFILKNILIKELSTMTEEDFKSGLGNLEDVVKTKLNEEMTQGKITNVYTVKKILQ